MNLKHLILGFSLLSLTACQSNPTKPPSTYLKYIDANSFDQQLSQTMQQGESEIEIDILSPFSSNNIPDRLNNWLSAISQNNGEVKPKPAEGERDIIQSIQIILTNIFTEKYAPAANYNTAELIYRRNQNGEAMIEKLIFTNR